MPQSWARIVLALLLAFGLAACASAPSGGNSGGQQPNQGFWDEYDPENPISEEDLKPIREAIEKLQTAEAGK